MTAGDKKDDVSEEDVSDDDDDGDGDDDDDDEQEESEDSQEDVKLPIIVCQAYFDHIRAFQNRLQS